MSRSAYYKWLRRSETERDRLDHELCQIILEYHEAYGHILGYRRMTLWINVLNSRSYNVKRIRRLMRLMGISSVIRRKRKGYVRSTPQVTAENVLNREFEAKNPNEKWLTDVTELKMLGERRKLYLSAILDLYDKTIVSYDIGTSNNNKLVFDTFDKAIAANPGAKPLFHSDRGFQYTSKTFKAKIDKIHGIQSMSRVGHCIDNGPMEGFWGIIKSEMYYLKTFHKIQELKEAIETFIHFYNYIRIGAKQKGLTPVQYRNQALQIQ